MNIHEYRIYIIYIIIYIYYYTIYIYIYMKYANQCKGRRLQFLDGKLKSNEQPHTLAMLWHRQRGWAECCVDLPQVESAPAHHCEARRNETAASVLVPLLVIESANLQHKAQGRRTTKCQRVNISPTDIRNLTFTIRLFCIVVNCPWIHACANLTAPFG